MLYYDYALLTVLSTVVQEGSFQRAAEKLNVSQSAVSQRVKTLEARLGERLLVRGNNQRTLPTEKGQMLCAHIEMLRVLEEDLKIRCSSDKSLPKIRVAANHDSLATWFPAVLARVRRELHVTLEIVPEDEGHTAEKLATGEVVAALTSCAVPQHGFRQIHLGATRYIGVASPAYMREFFPDGVSPTGLRNAPAVLFNSQSTLSLDWARSGFDIDSLFPAHWVPSFAGYLRACLDGVGWGIMPDFHVQAELDSGKLVPLKQGHTYNVALYWHHSATHTEIMSSISAIVKDVARRSLDRVDPTLVP